MSKTALCRFLCVSQQISTTSKRKTISTVLLAFSKNHVYVAVWLGFVAVWKVVAVWLGDVAVWLGSVAVWLGFVAVWLGFVAVWLGSEAGI